MSLRTTVLGQMSEIRELHAADRRRQAVISEMLKADHRRSAVMRELRTIDHTRQQQLIQTLTMMQSLHGQVTTLQGQVAALQGQVTALQGQNAPKRTTRSTPVTTTPAPIATTTTSVTNAQLQAMIDQGVTAALAARDANRNGDDSHTSGTGGRRTERIIKFSTCTLLAGALTWVDIPCLDVSHDVAYAMTWADLRKKLTDKYCPRNEMKKLEAELMFPKESDKIERYVSGLPNMIHGNIVALNPKTMQEAVEMATELMDKKVSTIAERQAENKRKFENTSRNIQNQQQQNKRQNTGRAYNVGTGEKKPYGGSKPLCAKCNYHHDGPCAPKCYKCNKVGHFARDWRANSPTPHPTAVKRGVGVLGKCNNANNLGATVQAINLLAQKVEFKTLQEGKCPKQKNNKKPDGNQVGKTRAPSKYRSFVSTAFSSQMDITPSTLDHYYDVELADGRIIRQKLGEGGLDVVRGWCNRGHKAHLHIISYSKTQEYMLKGCPVFLAHFTTNEVEDKSEKKRLEDVPIVRYFPEDFPEDLPGLPPT
ncbi:putative reverse transcriptase domain-containing protein [Tanacetum coccineum]